MADYIVHTPSKQALHNAILAAVEAGELQGIASVDDEGRPFLSITQTPNKDNVDRSLMVTRNIDRANIELLGLQILGEVINNEYVFEGDGKDIYEQVWQPFEELSYTDEDGNIVEYLKPYTIGVFA